MSEIYIGEGTKYMTVRQIIDTAKHIVNHPDPKQYKALITQMIEETTNVIQKLKADVGNPLLNEFEKNLKLYKDTLTIYNNLKFGDETND